MAFLRVRLCCKRCISKWAHCCPTYGHFTLFVCVLCGCQLLLNRRKDPRDWRCGRDLVRDRHYGAWSSRQALVGNLSAGNGCASINPTRIPSSAPSISPFSSIPISIFWSSLLYLLAVSQRPHTTLRQVGAGLHIPYGRSCPFFSFVLHLCYWSSRFFA